MGLVAFAAAVLLLAQPGSAQVVTFSYPLQGYYREGRYVPVRVVSSGFTAKHGTLTLRADGALPVELPLGEGESRVPTVPLLVLGNAFGNPRWSLSGGGETLAPYDALPKALAADERLVAVATDSPDVDATRAAALFPRMRVVPVPLDTSQPRLLNPPAAWEALDGVVLDAPAAGKVTESQLRVLLAAGTVVAVRAEAKPAGDWPWRREGPYWVLRHDVAGPRDVVEADAYEPTYAWVRGWPAGVRRQAVLGAVVFAILLLALTLWRSRYAVWAGVAVCVMATVLAAAWAARRPTVLRAGGEVLVTDAAAGTSQRDRWSYFSALRAGEASQPFDDLTRPVFFTRRQAGDLAVRLVCDADGRPERFVASLPEDRTLAFVSRGVVPHPPGEAPGAPVTSPLYVLANRLYPGRIVGQTASAEADGETWPAVFLQRAPPATGPAD